MKICFVFKEDYPWDVRVEKIVETLAESGHEVTVVARNLKRLPRRETIGHFEVWRLPALPCIFGKLNDFVSIPFFLNPLWLVTVARTILATGALIVIVRDLPLMVSILAVAKLFRRKIVFDMAECYPEMYASALQHSDRKFLRLIMKNPQFAAIQERIAVRHADHVFVMIEESRDRLLRIGGIPSRCSIVSNTPPLRNDCKPRPHTPHEPLKLVYVGFVNRVRGIDNAISGLASYLDHYPDHPGAEIHVVGRGAAVVEWERLAETLGVGERVFLHGWQEQAFVDELYSRADAGLLTYHVTSHWNHTIPNKLFDYMLCGIPVITTEVKPIRRIVEEVGCGVVCRDSDAQSFAKALAVLADPGVRADMGRRGHEAVIERYNWRVDSRRMLNVIDGMALDIHTTR